MAVIQDGTTTTNLAAVDANNNLHVNLPTTSSDAGFVSILDSAGNPINSAENGYLQVSPDTMVFYEQVDGSSLNTNKWVTSTSTMQIAQASGFITLNSASSLATGVYAILSSIKQIAFYGDLPVKLTISAKVSVQPQANCTMELGFGSVATTAAPTDGAFFRWSANGDFRAVVSNSGIEIQSSVITPPVSNAKTLFDLVAAEDGVDFYIDDVLVAAVDNSIGIAFPFSAGHQSVFARSYTGGTAPNQAPQISIGQVKAVQQGINQYKTWQDVCVSVGNGGYQSPTAFTQTSNHANSTSPSSATLSNTAAGYTTLGGRYQFAAVGGAATDYALFAFQVPTPFQMYITGVRISCVNTGAAVGTSATILDWSLGINSSAVSLATSDSPPTSWAPRRMPLGTQGFLVSDAIGKTATDINVTLNSPVAVDAGRYIHIILQMPVGTATGSQVIRGDVMINGFFE